MSVAISHKNLLNSKDEDGLPGHVVSIEALDSLFAKACSENQTICIGGNCICCGKHIVVRVTRTESGYGFLGGILLKQDDPKRMSVDFQNKRKQIFGLNGLAF